MLVVFEFGQPILEKWTDCVAINVVVAIQVIGNLGGDIAWALQLCGESFEQGRHAFSI